MNIPRTVPIAGLLIGFPGLIRALLLLDQDPFVAVLGLLSAMTVLLASVACLCGDDKELEPARNIEDRSTF